MTDELNGARAAYWRLKLGESWTVPVVELVRGEPKGTSILLTDAGRRADPAQAERLQDDDQSNEREKNFGSGLQRRGTDTPIRSKLERPEIQSFQHVRWRNFDDVNSH